MLSEGFVNDVQMIDWLSLFCSNSNRQKGKRRKFHIIQRDNHRHRTISVENETERKKNDLAFLRHIFYLSKKIIDRSTCSIIRVNLCNSVLTKNANDFRSQSSHRTSAAKEVSMRKKNSLFPSKPFYTELHTDTYKHKQRERERRTTRNIFNAS